MRQEIASLKCCQKASTSDLGLESSTEIPGLAPSLFTVQYVNSLPDIIIFPS
jgi:hypothetical protein